MAARTSPIRRADRRHRFAFTLVEVMVTVIVLAVVAGMVGFRLRSNIRRRRDLSAARIEATLETLAFRQLMSQDRIALSWDGVENILRLERLFSEDNEQAPEWRRDLLAPDIRFDDPAIQITEIRFDGERIAIHDFVRTELPIDEIRPTIEIDMQWEENMDLIQLLPHEIKPIRFGIGFDESSFANLEPVDLDAEGSGDDEW